jgi:hypothetical protein
MIDLILGLRQAVKGGAQDKVEIMGSRHLLGPFWDLGLCNGYGNVGPWVHPCLGIFCLYKYMLRQCSEHK